MRSGFLNFLCFFLFLFLFSCSGNETVKTVSDTVKSTMDTVVQKTESVNQELKDTIFSLEQNGQGYQLVLTHPRNDSDDYVTKTRVRILQGETVLADEVFSFNTVGSFQEPKEGIYFIDLLNSGGGSGFSGTIYRVITGDKSGLLPVTNFNELTSWKFSKNADTLLCASGYWAMESEDDDSFEAHFDAHQQTLFLCRLKDGAYKEELIGTTKGKYDLTDDAGGWKKLKEGEPELSKKISWEEFE